MNNNENRYYWICSIELAPDSIVLPGNWYRVVRLAPNHPSALLEEVYERIRSTRFPQMPSRRNSVFVFLDKLIAIELQQQRPFDNLYEVQIENVNANRNIFDMEIVNRQRADGTFRSIIELEEQAIRYWESVEKIKKTPEVLIEGPIRIIKKVCNGLMTLEFVGCCNTMEEQ